MTQTKGMSGTPVYIINRNKICQFTVKGGTCMCYDTSVNVNYHNALSLSYFKGKYYEFLKVHH